MNPPFVSGFRFSLLLLTVFVCFSILGGRLYYLHVIKATELASIVEATRRNVEVLPARRGNIVDRRGNLLAVNRAFIQIGVDPHFLREQDREKWAELARLVELPYDELRVRMETRYRRGRSDFGDDMEQIRWRLLNEGVEESRFEKITALDIRGVYGNRFYRRTYPSNELAAHVLGFVNREQTAVMGVEQHLDFYLRGEPGWRETERDGRRRELVQFRHREMPPKDGFHVELTIDSVIQHMVERELAALAERFSPEGATIIVSEPHTGHILALANYPTFNLNEFNLAPLDHQRNRAITDTLEPGSTFKIVPTAGALEERLVTPMTVFDCSQTHVMVGNYRARLPSDHRPFGNMTVAEIVAQSSNRGVAFMAVQMGRQRMYNYSRAFGFGQRTGLPMIGEVNGTLHPINRWDGLTITRLPIGHAISATPMQIHQATATLANDGVRMRPRLIERVFDHEGKTIFSYPPEAEQRVVSAETARTMGMMLLDAVGPRGTARRAEIPGFEVAGKTGTTRKLVNGQYSNREHVASFTGYFPVSQPRIVMTIIVDNPSGTTSYGGVVAAPSFRTIGEELIAYLGIRTRESEENMLARWEGGRR